MRAVDLLADGVAARAVLLDENLRLDVYSLSASIEAVLTYLDAVDPEAAGVARQRYGCLAPWRAEPVRYGRMALSRGHAVCEKPVTDALIDLLRKRLDYLHRDGETFFNA